MALLAIGAILLAAGPAQAQDLRQLTQQVRQLEEQSAREIQLARQAQVEAQARVTALEADRATLAAQVTTLLARIEQLEETSRSPERMAGAQGGVQVSNLIARIEQLEEASRARVDLAPAQTPAQPGAQTAGPETTRGFEPSGSGWRFAVGSSYLEISENGVQLRSGGDLLVEGSTRLELKGGQETSVSSGLDLRITSGMAMVAQSGMNFSLNSGGAVSLQNASGGRLGLQGGMTSLFGELVQLGSGTQLRSVAHEGSSVAGGSVLVGSPRVMVGN